MYAASPELRPRPWVSLPATTGKLTVPQSGYAPAWPQKPSITSQRSGLRTQTVNQHTGKCAPEQKDTRRTLFTSCLQTLDMYKAPLQIIYRVKPSPDVGYAFPRKLLFPSRLHQSQHSQQLPSPIVASATTLTRRHLHHSLTSSLLSCFCILPEASAPSPVPRQPPAALKIIIPSLKGLRSALLPFPVHSG